MDRSDLISKTLGAPGSGRSGAPAVATADAGAHLSGITPDRPSLLSPGSVAPLPKSIPELFPECSKKQHIEFEIELLQEMAADGVRAAKERLRHLRYQLGAINAQERRDAVEQASGTDYSRCRYEPGYVVIDRWGIRGGSDD